MAPTALVFGEALIDEYPDGRSVAGAPVHVAAHLAALGWQARLITRVGDDDDGRSITATCRDHGVDVSLIEVEPELATGTTLITPAPRGHSFEVRFPAAWDLVHGPDPVPDHDVLVTGSLPLRHPTAAATLRRLLDGSTGFIAVDANLRPPHMDLAALEGLLRRATLVKANDEEDADLAGLDFDPEWRCITRGAHGASLHHRDGRRWSVPGTRVTAVDTVGAGDAFLAALLDGLVRGPDPGEALATADRIASMTVSRRGGMPLSGTAGPAGSG